MTLEPDQVRIDPVGGEYIRRADGKVEPTPVELARRAQAKVDAEQRARDRGAEQPASITRARVDVEPDAIPED